MKIRPNSPHQTALLENESWRFSNLIPLGAFGAGAWSLTDRTFTLDKVRR